MNEQASAKPYWLKERPLGNGKERERSCEGCGAIVTFKIAQRKRHSYLAWYKEHRGHTPGTVEKMDPTDACPSTGGACERSCHDEEPCALKESKEAGKSANDLIGKTELVSAALMKKIWATYSADRIAANRTIKAVFDYAGAKWVVVTGNPDTCCAIEVIPLPKWEGAVNNIGENPLGFYHGVAVTCKTYQYVLSSWEVVFRKEEK